MIYFLHDRGKRKIFPAVLTLFLGLATAASGDQRTSLLPKLRPGQILTYLVHCSSDKKIKTESRVVVPLQPAPSRLDAHGLLRIEILDVQEIGVRLAVHARTRFLPSATSSKAANPAAQKSNLSPQCKDSAAKFVEFTISSEGFAEKISGLADLAPEEQQIWQEWVARFAEAWTIPAQRARIGDKWNARQPELTSSPIAALAWVRDSTYVRNEPCRAAKLSNDREISPSSGAADTCAVLLTAAKLLQNSSPRDATPEGFKLHELKTLGTAKGSNEIVTYISLTTGLVVRANQEAKQQMDVVVAKSDGSNGVHYNVDASSSSEVLLVTETPVTTP